MKYKVGIIGAGSIGALKADKYDTPQDSKNILTHCHAVFQHPQTELIGIHDSIRRKAYQAAYKWDTECIYSIEALSNYTPDIIIVTTPQNTHYEVMKKVIVIKPKLIICEKPFCDNKEQAIDIMLDCKKANIPLIINYTRRFSTKMMEAVKDIRMGSLGEIYNCRILYDRGFVRDACHALDFFRCILGDFISGYITGKTPYFDYSEEDPTYTACLNYSACYDVDLVSVNGKVFDIWECDIIGENGRIIFCDHGLTMNYYPVIEEKTYGNYNTISSTPMVTKTDLKQALSNLLTNGINHLENNENILCTPHDAIAVWDTMDLLKKSLWRKGK